MLNIKNILAPNIKALCEPHLRYEYQLPEPCFRKTVVNHSNLMSWLLAILGDEDKAEYFHHLINGRDPGFRYEGIQMHLVITLRRIIEDPQGHSSRLSLEISPAWSGREPMACILHGTITNGWQEYIPRYTLPAHIRIILDAGLCYYDTDF